MHVEPAPAESEFVALGGVLQDLPRLAEPYRQAGFGVHEIPLLRVVALADPGALLEKVRRLREYGSLYFEDPHTVAPFLEALTREGQDLRALHGLRLEAHDEATATALESHRLRPDSIGEEDAPEPGASAARRLRLCSPGAPDGVDRVAAYAHERFLPDLDELRMELAEFPPRQWMAAGFEAQAPLAALRQALADFAPAGAPLAAATPQGKGAR